MSYTPPIGDATTTSKGIIQLTGDLGGTATSPTVSKVNGITLSGTPAAGQMLVATAAGAASWQTPSVAVSAANLPAGSTLTVAKSGSTWPARPTSRNDIVVQWKGPDPSPSIVTSGTGGMLDNVDIRLVTP